MPVDPWAQYAEKSAPPPGADEWAQYAEKPKPVKNQGLAEGEVPLTSHLAATGQGLSTIGGGAINAVKGAANMIMHPIDTATSLYHAPGQFLDQIKQVPGAIRDINESPDPAGTYLKVAGDTAGEAGGQAVVGAATPELPGMAKDAVTGIGPKTRALAKVGAQDVASHVPVVGRLVRRPSIGDYIDAARAKAPEAPPVEDSLTPIQQAWKARGGTLVGERPIQRFPRPAPSNPAPEVPMEIKPSPPEPHAGLGTIKPPTPEPKPPVGNELGTIQTNGKPAVVNTKPGRVGELLNQSLGGKPLEPNVPLRQQIPSKPSASVTLPEGHIATESSAIKSYSYDPAKREFTSVTPTGATYIHGDVSPEQVAAFEAAPSKGKAWNDLRKGSPLVGKVVNGQRVNAKPPTALASASPAEAVTASETQAVEVPKIAPKAKAAAPPGTTVPEGDMTDLLQKSVQQAKAGKSATRLDEIRNELSQQLKPKGYSDQAIEREANDQYKYEQQMGELKQAEAATAAAKANPLSWKMPDGKMAKVYKTGSGMWKLQRPGASSFVDVYDPQYVKMIEKEAR
jgi:hypothetical protein